MSPSRNSWWAIAADLVVERLEDQGVAGGFEVGGAEEVGGLGVGEGDVPAGLGVVLPVFVFLGVVGGDGVGDEPVDDDGAAGAAVGELFVDPDRGGLGEAVGLAGDPAGLPGRHLQPDHAFPQHREAVAQVEGVGDQLRPGRRGHAQRQRERFRGERRHGGVPSPPSDSSASRAGPTEGLDTGVLVAGWRSAQWAASWSLRNSRSRSSRSSSRGELEHSAGVEVADLVLLPDRGAHGPSQASTTDTRGRESPVSTGVSHRDLLVIWPSATLLVLAGFRGSSLALLAPQPANGAGAPSSTNGGERQLRGPRSRLYPRACGERAGPSRGRGRGRRPRDRVHLVVERARGPAHHQRTAPTDDPDALAPRRPPCPNQASRPASTPG